MGTCFDSSRVRNNQFATKCDCFLPSDTTTCLDCWDMQQIWHPSSLRAVGTRQLLSSLKSRARLKIKKPTFSQHPVHFFREKPVPLNSEGNRERARGRGQTRGPGHATGRGDSAREIRSSVQVPYTRLLARTAACCPPRRTICLEPGDYLMMMMDRWLIHRVNLLVNRA